MAPVSVKYVLLRISTKRATHRLLPRIATMMFRRGDLVKLWGDFGVTEAEGGWAYRERRWGAVGKAGAARSIAP